MRAKGRSASYFAALERVGQMKSPRPGVIGRGANLHQQILNKENVAYEL